MEKSVAPQPKDVDKKVRAREGRGHGARRLVLVAAAILVVLALALGLGLGLGLKHRHSNSSGPPATNSTNSTTPEEPSNASELVPPWRRATLDYTLDMGWDINAPPTTRVFNLTLSETDAAPDGVVRKMLVINGQFPGPLLRVNRGDRVLVNVTNEMTNGTSIHWHGMFQNGTNWMDGTVGITQCPIAPDRSFLYNFTVENQYGTYWYHSHMSTQYTDGAVGPFIVHAPEEAEARKDYDVDQILLVSDWYHDLSSALLPGYLASGNENNEPVPDNGLIQGTNFFDCSSLEPDSDYGCLSNSTRYTLNIERQKRYRIRLINTGAFALFQFSIDNHTLSVIEADGTMVQPLSVHRLSIAVAQRYSFILTANQTATNYWIRSQMNTYCFALDNPVLDPDVRALLTYTNSTTGPTESIDWADQLDLICEDLNTTALIPTVSRPPPPASTVYEVTVGFNIGAYALDRAYINGTSWTAPTVPTLNQALAGLSSPNTSLAAAFTKSGVSSAFSANQYVISIPSPTTIDLLITNFDDGAHPFHLHGHAFWIMATGTEQYFDWSTYAALNSGKAGAEAMRRDTLTIDAYGWALIRFTSSNAGMWALHCHISWHMEAGLLMQFQARDDIMKTWTLPADVAGLCKA